MSDHSVVESHPLDVSREGVFRLLRESFTHSTAVLSELLQNGRRAGATRMLVEWEPDLMILTVTDDGCGIRNFKSLLMAGESGWDPEVQFREHPFGVGLFAAIYASRSVKIHSLNRQVELNDALFRGVYAQVATAPARQGTEIRLALHERLRRTTENWRAVLHQMVMGFPIPVLFNGELLPRPHALDSGLAFQETSIGKLHLRGWDEGTPTFPRSLPTLYCQGLPMRTHSALKQEEDVLHVDTQRFRARSPDHDVLFECDKNEPLIREAIFTRWQARLLEIRRERTPQEFVDGYWRTCLLLDMYDLLRDMPLSASMLSRYKDPVNLNKWEFGHSAEEWLQGLPDQTSLLVMDCDDYWDVDDPVASPLASVYAWVRGLPVLASAVPQCHWAWSRAVDLIDPTLGLDYELNSAHAPVDFDGFVQCAVQICESYTIRFIPTRGCTVQQDLLESLTPIRVTEHAFYDPKRNRLIVPAGEQSPGRALGQVSDYKQDELFQGNDFDRDTEAVTGLVDSLRARSPLDYVYSLLQHVTPNPEVLGDQKFCLRYDAPHRRWDITLL